MPECTVHNDCFPVVDVLLGVHSNGCAEDKPKKDKWLGGDNLVHSGHA
jgi:hypothetical protein